MARGKLSPSDRIVPAWIYMPTEHNPGASTTEPKSGLADNCGGYNTADDTIGWTGATVEWGPLDSGEASHHWEVLIDAGLCRKDREGQLRYCSLNVERLREATDWCQDKCRGSKKRKTKLTPG